MANDRGFRLLVVQTLTVGVLNRTFIGKLYTLLGQPVIDNVIMSDDDMLELRDRLPGTSLMIPMQKSGELNGSIAFYVNDLEAAAAWLTTQGISFVRCPESYPGLDLKGTVLDEPGIIIRLDQAPDRIKLAVFEAVSKTAAEIAEIERFTQSTANVSTDVHKELTGDFGTTEFEGIGPVSDEQLQAVLARLK